MRHIASLAALGPSALHRKMFLFVVPLFVCLCTAPPVGDLADAAPPLFRSLAESNQQEAREAEPPVPPEPDPEPLSADFMVEELVYVDPVTEEETWEVVGLSDDDRIENGLRVRLNGQDYSTGAVTYHWWEDGYPLGRGAIIELTYYGPAQYEIELTAYDESGENSDSMTRHVYVAGGMHRLSTMPWSGDGEFLPAVSVMSGSKVWTGSTNCRLGVADVSDPYDPDPITFMPTQTLYTPSAMVLYQDLLYIANRSSGVLIYRADPLDFELVGQVDVSALDGEPADTLAGVGDALYVGSKVAGRVVVFDLSVPSAPTRVTCLDFADGVWTLSSPGLAHVMVRAGYSYELSVIDARDEFNPVTLPALQLPAPSARELDACVSVGGVNSSSGIALVKVWVSGEQMQSALGAATDRGGPCFDLTGNRLYLVDGDAQRIDKFDITDPDTPYGMSTLSTSSSGLGSPLFHDPDGEEGPEAPVLLVGARGWGFKIYSP